MLIHSPRDYDVTNISDRASGYVVDDELLEVRTMHRRWAEQYAGARLFELVDTHFSDEDSQLVHFYFGKYESPEEQLYAVYALYPSAETLRAAEGAWTKEKKVMQAKRVHLFQCLLPRLRRIADDDPEFIRRLDAIPGRGD